MPELGKHLFGQGYSLAAVIANEFGEAQGLHRSALFAAGLVLFILTLLVNGVARVFVLRASRPGRPRTEGKPSPDANDLLAGAAAGA
jgi:phosphate transport system permease protein